MISVPANEIYRCWQNPNKATPSYYKFVQSSINWPTARSSCIESGGHLVAMETDEEFLVIQQFVQHYFPGKEKVHWFEYRSLCLLKRIWQLMVIQ